jgi:branched-subunit amino acid aminotransferase/4-amino-4-deoxychorismate lyase
MTEPVALLNGEFIPATELTVPVYDSGFMQGVTVSEQMRTFHGILFRLDQHLERLRNSLSVVGLDQEVETARLAEWAVELVTRNHALLEQGDDLGLSLFVTPGPYPTLAPKGVKGAMVGMHTYPIPFHQWIDLYEQGQPLEVSDIRQVPAACWPTELKCRSRMHYYLADLHARRKDGAARALLLDAGGFVNEASTANLVIYRRDEGLVSPPRNKILPGVSMAMLQSLAVDVNIPFIHREVTIDDVLSADEAMLTSTSPCLLPVRSLNGQRIGEACPGPVFGDAIERWGDQVGVAIVQQARTFASR